MKLSQNAEWSEPLGPSGQDFGDLDLDLDLDDDERDEDDEDEDQEEEDDDGGYHEGYFFGEIDDEDD